MYERARSPLGGRARSVSGVPVPAVGRPRARIPATSSAAGAPGAYPGRVGAMNGRLVRQR